MFPESRYIIIADHIGHFLHGIYLLLQQHGRLTQRHRVGWLKYNTFSDNSKSVSNGSPLALYYYTGKNIAPETTRRTTIKITATSGRNSKTYTIELGADSPNVENRNYSIYRNNNYTFNINLK